MKKLFKNSLYLLAMGSMVLLASCGGDDEPTTPDAPTVTITSSSFAAGATSYAGTAGETVSVVINVNAPGGFNTLSADILVNGTGSGDPFTASKAAGSTELTYTSPSLDIALTEELSGAEITIRASVTDDNNLTTVVEVSVTVASRPLNAVVATLLAAPLGDRSSATFYSVPLSKAVTASEVVDGSAGTAMSADIDFGYYWLETPGASLAAPSDYPSAIYDLGANGQNWGTLNATTFRKTTLSPTAFNEQATHDDIELAYTNGTDEGAVMQTLAADEVIAFQTAARDGKQLKGLILIKSIVAGLDANGQITIEVLVQQ